MGCGLVGVVATGEMGTFLGMGGGDVRVDGDVVGDVIGDVNVDVNGGGGLRGEGGPEEYAGGGWIRNCELSERLDAADAVRRVRGRTIAKVASDELLSWTRRTVGPLASPGPSLLSVRLAFLSLPSPALRSPLLFGLFRSTDSALPRQ
jgi:hypothetical protein